MVRMLLPREKKLADKLLRLTKTAREEDATVAEQGLMLHQMGELYLRDAIETGNGEHFVKASALINAALVRTEDPSDQHVLQELLCNIYISFLTKIESDSCGLSVDKLINTIDSNKDVLHDIRVEIDGMCEISKDYLDSDFYIYTLIDNTRFLPRKMEEEMIKETIKVSARVQTRMLEYVKRLWGQATDYFSESPPCQYAVIGLGSLARQETTPYSDLEFALLIEKDSEEIKQYFKNLVYLFHLHILDLGETPIPAVAIESLNDFLSPDGDRFYDGITSCGFRLDGAMPWACKTPIGRKGTPQREPLDLIKTPEGMAALLREDNVLGQAYHVSDILCNSILICGDSRTFNSYITLSEGILSKINHREKAKRSIIKDYNQSPDWDTIRFSFVNPQTKTLFYRFPSSFVENLRIYYTPDYQPSSSWKVLDHLCDKRIISEEGVIELGFQLSFCYGLRILTYLKNRGQYENLRFPVKNKYVFSKVRPKNPFEARQRCRLAYFRGYAIFDRLAVGCNGIRNVIETEFLNKSISEIDHLMGVKFDSIQLEGQLFCSDCSGSITSNMFANLGWARSTKELPSNGCGVGCGVQILSKFSFILVQDYRALVKAIDELIDIKGCKCLLLLRTSLLVSKVILIKYNNMEGNIPKEANILELLQKYKRKGYKSVRERYYLLLDITISAIALFVFDKNVPLTVTDEIQIFLDDVDSFPESEKRMVNLMKYHLIQRLGELYAKTGQFDKGVKLCQQQINEYERLFGLDAFATPTAEWHVLMGDLKTARSLEALEHYKKALEIRLNLQSNTLFDSLGKSFAYGESERKFGMRTLRQTALTVAQEYCDLQRNKDAVKVLTDVLTKNGKSFDIETNKDIEAMCLLTKSCRMSAKGLVCGEYLLKGNQYFEELLEVIMIKGDRHLYHPAVVKMLIDTIYTWIVHLGRLKYDPRGSNSTYVIEHTYRKYCSRKGDAMAKEEFLFKIVCKVLDNESLHRYLINNAHLPDYRNSFQEHSKLTIVLFFHLCKLSMCGVTEIYFRVTEWLELRRAILQQAEIFCEKVIKRIVSETIHKMYLIYIDFHRIRMNLFDYVFTADPEYMQTARELSVKTNLELPQYFPKCLTAFKLTDCNEFVKFENWVRDYHELTMDRLEYIDLFPNEV